MRGGRSCRLLSWIGADVKPIAPARTRSSASLSWASRCRPWEQQDTSRALRTTVPTAGRRPGGHLSSECAKALCSQPSLQPGDGSFAGTFSVSLPSPAGTNGGNREVQQRVAFCSRENVREELSTELVPRPHRRRLNPDTWRSACSSDHPSLQATPRSHPERSLVMS